MARAIEDLTLPKRTSPELPAPKYRSAQGASLAFAVESMRTHTTDEGWQLMLGLEAAGYTLCGRNLPIDAADVGVVLRQYPAANAVLQDKREWEGRTADRSGEVLFTNVEALNGCGAFVTTILKDAQHDLEYHRRSAEEVGCHAWIVYYHPKVVKALAPYVRERHLVRTYHSVDKRFVLPFQPRSGGTLLSGAVSGAYPLRTYLASCRHMFPGMDVLPHPGYDRKGCRTPEYLALLSRYRVAVCTSSVYGYAVRKIVEATACGCIVVTDLPTDDVLPGIDGNLVRVDPKHVMTHPSKFAELLRGLDWNPAVQEHYAMEAKRLYDYRAVGRKLATDLEAMRRAYSI